MDVGQREIPLLFHSGLFHPFFDWLGWREIGNLGIFLEVATGAGEGDDKWLMLSGVGLGWHQRPSPCLFAGLWHQLASFTTCHLQIGNISVTKVFAQFLMVIQD